MRTQVAVPVGARVQAAEPAGGAEVAVEAVHGAGARAAHVQLPEAGAKGGGAAVLPGRQGAAAGHAAQHRVPGDVSGGARC